ncbi:glycoside hydrolase family 88 protein [Litoreibacter albidus]|uniref:Glycosyl Hydrolase Family 88 n=1 Tax=Litoreibacter albidus TaxID=670155 RepID=A0A1H3CJ08_9RHOB|nr:glycoside hydrolase family 88 protein [Litoreibacter albidus]SDX54066.1 Glycosyl Hydrolase Family 88 [Litoreibacter albidus]
MKYDLKPCVPLLDGHKAVVAHTLAIDVTTVNTGWEDTMLALGAVIGGTAEGGAPLLNWARSWADHHLAAGFIRDELPDGYQTMQHSGAATRGFYLSPYCGEWGGISVLAELSRATGDGSYTEAAETIADHLHANALRWGDGTILHGHWSELPWVDTLYYTAAPLARLYRATRNTRHAVEAVRQCLLHAKHLRDPKTGLFFHEAHDDGRRTAWSWSRGNGWVVMTFADVLALCPQDTAGWDELMAIYRDLVTALLHHQHSSGLWRILLENDESHLETSGSVMIATGILSGIRNGWIDPGETALLRRTLLEVDTWVDYKGRLMGCQTPAGLGGWEKHKLSRMGERTYGAGAYLRLVADIDTP